VNARFPFSFLFCTFTPATLVGVNVADDYACASLLARSSALVAGSTHRHCAASQVEEDGPECVLRFLMVNGESFRMSFASKLSVREVKQSVIDQKPSELIEFLQASSPSSPPPSRVEEIRILHLGKFLDDAKILNGKRGVPTHSCARLPSTAQCFTCLTGVGVAF
jgi:Ubiquitin-2 like Rad60 SUMO-like